MPHRRNDDLGPALLALLALGLGLGAVAAIWSFRTTPAESAREEHDRTIREGELEWASHTFTYADAGVGVVPRPNVGFALTEVVPTAEEEVDPQVIAMRRSMARAGDAGVASFWPYTGTGTAVIASGVPGVARNATCDLRMLPVGSETGFNCVVRVRCDGIVIYPDGALAAGYAPCEIERGVPRTATDRAPTETDGDPELLVDLGEHVARIRDTRFGGDSLVEIRLD